MPITIEASNLSAIFIARHKGIKVGSFYLCGVNNKDKVHLVSFNVRKSYRRKGFGKKLIVAAISEAREAGFKFLTLDVYSSNFAAVSIYVSAGFTMTNAIPFYSDTFQLPN